MKHKKLRIGILGGGAMASLHMKVFSRYPGVTIAALAEPNEALRKEQVAAYNIRKSYNDYRYILSDPSINVVDIVLPHYLHGPVTIDALLSSKTVICEKPFATTIADAKRIMKAAKSSGRHVYLKQYFRFATLHQEATRMILGGAIDRPYAISCIYTTDARQSFVDPTSWKMTKKYAGGGVLMDIGVHIIDLLINMFGVPEILSGHLQQTIPAGPGKGEDLAVATMRFPGRVMATLLCTASDSSFGFGWKKTFFGLGGSIVIEDDGKNIMKLTYQTAGKRSMVKQEKRWWERANHLAITDILSRIKEGESPLVPLEEAYEGLATVAKIYEIAKT